MSPRPQRPRKYYAVIGGYSENLLEIESLNFFTGGGFILTIFCTVQCDLELLH